MFVLPHNPYYVVNPIKREAGKIPYLHGKKYFSNDNQYPTDKVIF